MGRDGRVAPSSPPVPSTRSSRQPSPRGRVTPAGRASGAAARHGRKAGDAIRRWRVAAEASDASGGRVEGLGLGGESSGSRACRRLHRFCPQRLHGPCRRSRRLGVVRENIRGWAAGDVAGVRHARDLPPRWHVRQETQRMVSWYLKFQKQLWFLRSLVCPRSRLRCMLNLLHRAGLVRALRLSDHVRHLHGRDLHGRDLHGCHLHGRRLLLFSSPLSPCCWGRASSSPRACSACHTTCRTGTPWNPDCNNLCFGPHYAPCKCDRHL